MTEKMKVEIQELRNPEVASGYVRAAAEDTEGPEMILVALRNVAEAHGMSEVAREAGVNRQGLYKMLSKEGNPSFRSLVSILKKFGLRLTVELLPAGTPKGKRRRK